MDGTVEVIDSNIHAKIRILRWIATHYALQMQDLHDFEQRYMLGSAQPIAEYYLFINSAKFSDPSYYRRRDEIITRYMTFIRRTYVENGLDTVARTYRTQLQKIPGCRDAFDSYDNLSIHRASKPTKQTLCTECGAPLDSKSEAYLLICMTCGLITELKESTADDDGIVDARHTGGYDLSKHCRLWLDRIQAREAKDVPISILTELRHRIKADKIIYAPKLTCPLLRDYLRSIRQTDYYNHVPLIRKLLTGVSPPQLTDEELIRIDIIFAAFIKAFFRIKPPNKTNLPYHPYFIYKILEHILPEEPRTTDILSCIHLQSTETIIANDVILIQMCEYISASMYKYRPTIRNV